MSKIFYVAASGCILAFLTTYFIKKIFYPPRNSNFRLYEKSVLHSKKIKKFIILTNCYSSFAVGTNNVANVVALIMLVKSLNSAYGDFGQFNLLRWIIFIAVSFGLGSLFFGKGTIDTISKEIIPIGEIFAGIISLVTASFVVIASLLGFLTPYVQLATFSVFAISAVKDGLYLIWKKAIVKKIICICIITPFVTFLLSYYLHLIFRQ